MTHKDAQVVVVVVMMLFIGTETLVTHKDAQVLEVVQASLAPMLAAAARDNDLLKQEYEHMVRSNEDLNSQLLESKKEIRQLELIVQRQPLNNVVGSEVNGGSSKRTEELEEALHKATLMQRSLLADHQALQDKHRILLQDLQRVPPPPHHNPNPRQRYM